MTAATVANIIQDALDMLGVTAGAEAPEAADETLARRHLNTLLRSMNISGGLIPLGTDLGSADPIPLAPELIHGLSAMLAERVAPAFDIDPPPAMVIREAKRGREVIQAATGPDWRAETDPILHYRPRYPGGFS